MRSWDGDGPGEPGSLVGLDGMPRGQPREGPTGEGGAVQAVPVASVRRARAADGHSLSMEHAGLEPEADEQAGRFEAVVGLVAAG